MKTYPVSDDGNSGGYSTPWKRGEEKGENQSTRWGRLVFSISPNMTCPLKIKAKETGEANGKRRSVLSLGHDELQPSAAARLRWHVDCPWFRRCGSFSEAAASTTDPQRTSSACLKHNQPLVGLMLQRLKHSWVCIFLLLCAALAFITAWFM